MPNRSRDPTPCGLCGTTAILQNSHVIPEFAYAPIYDDKHKLIAFQPLKPSDHWKVQKGPREPLLCRGCEQFLNNNYERSFKELWFDARPLSVLESRDQAVLAIPEPARFKLFHLSVLLRADLARHGQWGEVDLGKRHRARLIEMVRRQDAGAPHEYPIVCCAIRRSIDDQRIWWDIVAPPSPGRTYGVRLYLFTFGGCGWMYFVSSHRSPAIEMLGLQPDGSLPVIKREWMAIRRYWPHAWLD